MYILVLLGLMWIAGLHADIPSADKPIKIDSPIIGIINGTSLLDIEGIINLRLRVRCLDLGEPKKECYYKEHFYSLRELAALEDRPDADKDGLQKTLNEAITLFEKFSEPYAKEGQAGKQFSIKIIAKWIEQRGRHDSHLSDWSKNTIADERVLFRKEIVSFKKFSQFCDDLTLFLLDLIYSCDKSYQKYREKKAAAAAAAAAAGKKSEHDEYHDGIEHSII